MAITLTDSLCPDSVSTCSLGVFCPLMFRRYGVQIRQRYLFWFISPVRMGFIKTRSMHLENEHATLYEYYDAVEYDRSLQLIRACEPWSVERQLVTLRRLEFQFIHQKLAE